MFQLQVQSEKFHPRAQALLRGVRDLSPLLAAVGRGVADLLCHHFDQLDQEHPNKHGWPRQRFWRDVRDSVQPPVVSGSGPRGRATVAITHRAIAQKIFGGTIEPRRSKYLTIPATAAAYGKRARDFSGLKFAIVYDVFTNANRPALVLHRGGVGFAARGPRAEKLRAAAHKLDLSVMFWLVRRVSQDHTPNALPDQAALNSAAAQAVNDWADSLNPKLSAN